MVAMVSSGNHGQGFAPACRLQGAIAHVVMPKPFSAMKHRAVLGYGAQVHMIENRAVLMQGYANSWMAIRRSWFNRIAIRS
jgi:threonine dehydratase